MIIANIICFVLVTIGSLNWFMVGAFKFNLVDFIFTSGSFMARLIYILVGLASMFLIFSVFYNKKIAVMPEKKQDMNEIV